MKKVTIIFPGWIKAPNGAAQFVFGLRSCINDFANQGIGLSTFTLDDVHGEVRNFSNNDKIKRKASLKNKLMRYAKYSHLMTYAMIYFSGLRYSKRIVEAFDEIPNDELPDIIHFQDLFACIIRKSKFPWFPERSVQFSGKRTKRSVQKKRLHTTLIKPEQKVNEDLCSGFIVS